MKIEKLPSGSYRFRKTYKGKTYTVITDYKPTQKEMLQLMAAEMDKVHVTKHRMTFETAAREYIQAKENILSPATIKGYSSVLNSISTKFKGTLISDITSLEIQKELNRYSKGRSAKTVRNMYGLIRPVMEMFSPNTILKVTLPMQIKKEPYIPSDQDIEIFLGEIRGTRFEIPIALAAFGLRRSEICALTVDDFTDNTVTINKALVQQKDHKWIIKHSKTPESTRTIYVPEWLVQKIREQGFVYKGYPGEITRRMGKIEEALGLGHFTLHKMRHYYASLSHSLGVPDANILKSGGWKTDNVMKSVYRHAMAEKQKESEKITGNHISDIFNPIT